MPKPYVNFPVHLVDSLDINWIRKQTQEGIKNQSKKLIDKIGRGIIEASREGFYRYITPPIGKSDRQKIRRYFESKGYLVEDGIHRADTLIISWRP